MTTANINLKEIYFEYKVIPIITVEPTLNALREILKQLKADTASFPGTLSEGANSYLGMLFSAQAYATMASGTPCIPPLMPAALVIGPNNTQYQTVIAKT